MTRDTELRRHGRAGVHAAFLGVAAAILLASCSRAQEAAPARAATAQARIVPVTLSADNPAIRSASLSVPAGFLDPRFPGAGEFKGNRYAVGLRVRAADPGCATNPDCRAVFAAGKATDPLEIGVRIAPDHWIAGLVASRKATGYFIYGAQILDEGVKGGIPGRLELSNAGQPALPDLGQGQWSPERPPLTEILCPSASSPVALCELQVEASDNLVVTSELPVVELHRWPEFAKALAAFTQSMITRN